MMATTTGTNGGPGSSSPLGGSQDKPNLDDADDVVGPLLARANLLRMRGQWDEAVTVCADALRRSPQSPTAHSLMGDIYDAQGKTTDAIQWYAMALDIAPNSRPDREKLDRLTKATQQVADAAARRDKSAEPRAATGSPASERTLEWFDRVFPPGKGEGIARLIFAVSGVATVLILGAAAFVYFTFVRDDARETETQAGKTGHTTPVAPAPQTALPRPASAPTPSASPAPSASPVTPVATPSTVPSAFVTPGGLTAVDDLLLSALKTALPSDVTMTAARFDARASQVSLEAVLPASARGEMPSATRERVLRAAILMAKTAQSADKRVIRAHVRIALAGDKGVAPVLAFTGHTTSVQMSSADPMSASYGDLMARFANPWWTTTLAPGA